MIAVTTTAHRLVSIVRPSTARIEPMRNAARSTLEVDLITIVEQQRNLLPSNPDQILKNILRRYIQKRISQRTRRTAAPWSKRLVGLAEDLERPACRGGW